MGKIDFAKYFDSIRDATYELAKKFDVAQIPVLLAPKPAPLALINFEEGHLLTNSIVSSEPKPQIDSLSHLPRVAAGQTYDHQIQEPGEMTSD